MNVIVVQIDVLLRIICVGFSNSDLINALVLEVVSLFLHRWSLLHPVSCLRIFIVDASLYKNLAILVIHIIIIENFTLHTLMNL